MDSEATDFDDYRACLADLANVNRLTGTHRATLAFLERLRRTARLPPDRPLRLLDVASGYGDLLRAIAAWARRTNTPVELIGLDLNPLAAKAAASATDPSIPISWVTGDLFDYRPAAPIDIITSTQFAHHLDDAQIARLLLWLDETAATGWLLTDLQRHRLAYFGFKLLSRLGRWHRFVRYDGAVSITRALWLKEWRALIEAAGLGDRGIEVSWQLPFRISLARVKPA